MGIAVRGEVAPGFEPVRQAFAKNIETGKDVGASFAVFRGSETIVNLWGGHRDAARSAPWLEDTLANVWSTTKGIAALVCAMLVDRGELDYDARVADYWPEFAGGGRSDISVSMLLSHQAGLSGPREPTKLLDFTDPDLINQRLLRQELLFEPGSACGYHALTHGPLVGELVRRACGRSLGTFVREEIAGPLACDFHIGLPEALDPRVAEMLRPVHRKGPARPEPEAINPVQALTFSNPVASPEIPNERAWRAAEIPSANGQANAVGIARIYAALALGGTLGNVRLLGPETVARMCEVQIADRDLVLGAKMEWTRGFVRNRYGILYGPNPLSFGHSGLGGSFGCADPEAGIGIGYAMNQMARNLVGDPRAVGLLEAVYSCLGEG